MGGSTHERDAGLRINGKVSLRAFIWPDDPPAEIGLGSAVRFSIGGGRSDEGMTNEGVVIEVVPRWTRVRTRRVAPYRPARSSVTRYVIQAWDCRVIRYAGQLRVDAL
jgi:hypothetical protein